MSTQKKKGTGSQGKRQQGTAERKEHSSSVTPKTQVAEARSTLLLETPACDEKTSFCDARQSLFHLLDTDALSLIIKK